MARGHFAKPRGAGRAGHGRPELLAAHHPSDGAASGARGVSSAMRLAAPAEAQPAASRLVSLVFQKWLFPAFWVWKRLLGFCFCLDRLRKVVVMFLDSLIRAKYVSPARLCFLLCASRQPLLQLPAGLGVLLAARAPTRCYPAGEKLREDG